MAVFLQLCNIITIVGSNSFQFPQEFDYVSTQQFTSRALTIGWIEFASCNQGKNKGINFHNGSYSLQQWLLFAKSAVTVKMLPFGDTPGLSERAEYSVTADLCNDQIFSLNNGYEMSYRIKMINDTTAIIVNKSDPTQWIGTEGAKKRLINNCLPTRLGTVPRTLSTPWWGCGNGKEGLHITPSNCWWEFHRYLNQNIMVWIGFDVKKGSYCTHVNGSYLYFNGTTTDDTNQKSPTYAYSNVSCTNLHENVVIQYDGTLAECMDLCYDQDVCEVFNYFTDFKEMNDSRCYIFDTLCTIKSDPSHKSAIGYLEYKKECSNYPTDWADTTGDGCDYYETYHWCANQSTLKSDAEFYNLMDYTYQLTAIDSCCECGGGINTMDGAAFSMDYNWVDFEDDILCTWSESSFKSHLIALSNNNVFRSWSNIILYDICTHIEGV
eukprot:166886_1